MNGRNKQDLYVRISLNKKAKHKNYMVKQLSCIMECVLRLKRGALEILISFITDDLREVQIM